MASDLEGISAADPQVRADPAREALLQSHIEGRRCWVAEDRGQVVGFFMLEYSFYGQGFVSLLVVRQDSRRRGVGRALLTHAMSMCVTSKLFTSTNESNTAMRSLLREVRFEPSGVIHNLDEDDPELVFCRRLRDL